MEKDGQQLVSKAEYARMRGWDRSYLSKKDVASRLAPAMQKDDRGRDLVDVAKANEIFRRETDTSKVRKAQPAEAHDEDEELFGEDLSPEDRASLDSRRRENLRLKNERLSMDIAKDKGETCHRPKVVSAGAVASQLVRESLFALSPGLAERFATMTDAREIRTVLDNALRTAMAGLENDFLRRIPAPEGIREGHPIAH